MSRHWRHKNANPGPPPTLHRGFAYLRHSCNDRIVNYCDCSTKIQDLIFDIFKMGHIKMLIGPRALTSQLVTLLAE